MDVRATDDGPEVSTTMAASRLSRLLQQPRRRIHASLGQPEAAGAQRLLLSGEDMPLGECWVDAAASQGLLLPEFGAPPDPSQPLWPEALSADAQRVWVPFEARGLWWLPAAGGAPRSGLSLTVESGPLSVLQVLARRLATSRPIQLLRLALQARATRRPEFVPAPTLRRDGDTLHGDDEGVRGLLYFGHAGVPRGLCRIRLKLSAEDPFVDAALYFDTGSGFSPASMALLHGGDPSLLRSEVFIPVGTRRIRLDPTLRPGPLRLAEIAIKPRSFRASVRRATGAALLRRAPRALDRLPRSLRTALLSGLDLAPSGDAQDYARYLQAAEPPLDAVRSQIEAHLAGFALRPTISVVMPTYNTPPALLERAIASVRAQLWPHWQLCIADDASRDPAVRRVLRRAAQQDARIRVVECAENGGISAASNAALATCDGDFVTFLDHDDELHPLALYHVAAALQHDPELELIYTDEDKIDADGRRFDPHFKPDWDPDLLASINYVAHLAVYRRERVLAVGGLRSACDGSQDYDLALRVTAQVPAARIHHVPMALYHWRAIPGSTALALDQKSYPHQAGLRALRERFGVPVADGAFSTSYRVQPVLPQPPPRVSLIVPTRDGASQLRVCLDSVLQRSSYPDIEILIVDNQSRDADTLALFDSAARDARVRVLRFDAPFNYSAINNFAAEQATGQVLVLLNDDTQVINGDWLEEMVGLALRPDTGAVGAKLYYPDGSIQHGGVGLGIGGVAGHLHLHAEGHSAGYLGRLKLRHTVGAVTGACLAVEKHKFDAVGGLDARNLAVAFNDIDLCLKLAERGWRSVWTPWAELVHFESKTRGPDTAPDKIERFKREIRYMQRRWGARLRNDPYYSPHFSRRRQDYGLAEQPFSLQPWARRGAEVGA